jgi:hypothetical protein
MLPSEPQFLYLMLVLPSLFGITLVGEGINKLIHEEPLGFVSIFFGITFICLVVFVYFFFSSQLNIKV